MEHCKDFSRSQDNFQDSCMFFFPLPIGFKALCGKIVRLLTCHIVLIINKILFLFGFILGSWKQIPEQIA
jgi:hypothetical protein